MELLEPWALLEPELVLDRGRRVTRYKEVTWSLALDAICVSRRTRTLDCCVFTLESSYLTEKSNQNADMLQTH